MIRNTTAPLTATAKEPVVPGGAAGAERIYYTVRPGDTLSEIAEAYGVGLSKLREWNGFSGTASQIRVGQRLVIWKESG